MKVKAVSVFAIYYNYHRLYLLRAILASLIQSLLFLSLESSWTSLILFSIFCCMYSLANWFRCSCLLDISRLYIESIFDSFGDFGSSSGLMLSNIWGSGIEDSERSKTLQLLLEKSVSWPLTSLDCFLLFVLHALLLWMVWLSFRFAELLLLLL